MSQSDEQNPFTADEPQTDEEFVELIRKRQESGSHDLVVFVGGPVLREAEMIRSFVRDRRHRFVSLVTREGSPGNWTTVPRHPLAVLAEIKTLRGQ